MPSPIRARAAQRTRLPPCARLWLCVLLWAGIANSATAAGSCTGAVRQFAIPAQPLRAALLEFGRQSGCSLVFDPQRVPAVTAPALQGERVVTAGLDELLRPTTLAWRVLGRDILAVVPREPPATVVRARPAPAPPRPPPAPPARNDTAIETMLVVSAPTGSRIHGADFEGFAQIDILDRTALRTSTHQGAGELLRFLPAVAGNSTSTQVTNGGDGTASITLRGLPAANTLVLLDGRRLNSDAFQARAVDLNSLPLAMIERIEVLKDGASAVYGSDAIAGVVNVVTRRRFPGTEVVGYYGLSSRGDLQTRKLSVVTGADVHDTRMLLALSSYGQEGIASRRRALSRHADERPRGGVDQRSTATPFPRVVVDEQAYIRTAGDGDGDGEFAGFRRATDEDRFDHRDYTDAVQPSMRNSLFLRSETPLGPGRELVLDALLNTTSARNDLAPVPLFTASDGERTPISADAPENPFGVALADVRRRLVEFGPRRFRNRTFTQRYGALVEFAGERMDAELSLSYQRSAAQEHIDHVLRADRLANALDPAAACTLPCRRIDLLGGPGSLTPDDVAWLRTDTRSDGLSTLWRAAWDASFIAADLPAGPVRIAAGVDLRRESIDVDPDRALETGSIIGAASMGATHGDRAIREVYAEALVPLLVDAPWARSLDVSLAGRASHYEGVGSSYTPKLGLRYRPTDTLLLRAAWGRGFRAPTLQQLVAADEVSFDFLNDPCAGSLPPADLPGCRGAADPTLTQFATVRGGNRALKPERARTSTVGIVFTPADDVLLSADYFRIRQRDVVDANAQFVLNQNAFFGRFPDRVLRAPDGNLLRVFARPLNIGRRDVSGWDFTLRGGWALEGGDLQVALNAATIARYRDKLDPSAAGEDQAGTFSDEASSGNGALPHWKSTASVHWTAQRWRLAWDAYYVGPLRERVPGTDRRRRIDAWLSQDLQLSHTLPGGDDVEVSIGVENLFDEAPPFAASAFNDGFDGRTYSPAGRYFFLRLTGVWR